MLEHCKYLVSHMKVKPKYGPVEMLKELWENDEACFSTNTAHKSGNTDGHAQNSRYHDRKRYAYTAQATNVQPFPDIPKSESTSDSQGKIQIVLIKTDITLHNLYER